MPLQFPDFGRISFEEANPMLKGLGVGQNLMQNFLKFPQELKAQQLANEIAKVQAQYAEPMAKEGLTKAQQENLWNPRRWQSEIGLQGAQAAQAQAYAGQSHTETAMNQIKLNYLKSYLQGQSPMMGAGGGNAGMGGAQGQQGGALVGAGGAAGNIPGTQPQTAQPQNMQPQANTTYGIQNPQVTPQDIANKLIFGIDTFGPRQTQTVNQQQDQYKAFQGAIADSVKQANSAQKAQQVLAIFNKAMNESTYKGPSLGSLPVSGWASTFVPGDLTPERIAENQVANLLPGAITELREAMGSGQFSVADLNAASRMKVTRNMTDQERRTQSQWLNGVYNRMDEKAKFYSTIGQPQNGAEKIDADMLWQNYQKDFPLISADGKTYQASNANLWPLYTTPRAIASIKATGSYTPTRGEKNTFMMRIPDGNGGYADVPIKKKDVIEVFKMGGRPL